MKRHCLFVMVICIVTGLFLTASAFGSDIELAKKSTLETILKRGELLVGLEAGYQPFEMQDEKGNIVGFDVRGYFDYGLLPRR